MDVELRMIALPLSINIGVLNGPATAVLWFYAVMLQSTRSGQSDRFGQAALSIAKANQHLNIVPSFPARSKMAILTLFGRYLPAPYKEEPTCRISSIKSIQPKR
jgi:hypothetical protein